METFARRSSISALGALCLCQRLSWAPIARLIAERFKCWRREGQWRKSALAIRFSGRRSERDRLKSWAANCAFNCNAIGYFHTFQLVIAVRCLRLQMTLLLDTQLVRETQTFCWSTRDANNKNRNCRWICVGEEMEFEKCCKSNSASTSLFVVIDRPNSTSFITI